MAKQKKFGLVFEEHLPEYTSLYDISVKVGTIVAKRNGKVNDVYKALSVTDGVASCLHREGTEVINFPVTELVCVAEFGEPIYPYLKSQGSVCNAPDSDLWHTLIEADNYHALQFLEYLYVGKVDYIYIDPLITPAPTEIISEYDLIVMTDKEVVTDALAVEIKSAENY